jgi:hypothetical protein
MKPGRLIAWLAAAVLVPVVVAAPVDRAFERMDAMAYRDLLHDAAKAYNAKDYDQAFKLYRRGACSGDKFSQSAVGRMYLLGQGTTRNDLTAYAWLAVAAEFQFAGFQSVPKQLHEAMTPAQRRVADARAQTLRDLYGLRATGTSCSTQASHGGHITDTIVCTPEHYGGVSGRYLSVKRCEDAPPASD